MRIILRRETEKKYNQHLIRPYFRQQHWYIPTNLFLLLCINKSVAVAADITSITGVAVIKDSHLNNKETKTSEYSKVVYKGLIEALHVMSPLYVISKEKGATFVNDTFFFSSFGRCSPL